MARVTVEDCVLKVPNRFELVMLASQRSRSIAAGAPLTVERDDDKDPVIALREIAEETISLDGLRDTLVQASQKHVEIDEPEEDQVDFDMLGMELNPETAAAVDAAVTKDALAVEEVAATETDEGDQSAEAANEIGDGDQAGEQAAEEAGDIKAEEDGDQAGEQAAEEDGDIKAEEA